MQATTQRGLAEDQPQVICSMQVTMHLLHPCVTALTADSSHNTYRAFDCMQAASGQLPERSFHKRRIEPALSLMAVGQKGLQAVYSSQTNFCEGVPEEGPEARYQLLQRACWNLAAAKHDG